MPRHQDRSRTGTQLRAIEALLQVGSCHGPDAVREAISEVAYRLPAQARQDLIARLAEIHSVGEPSLRQGW